MNLCPSPAVLAAVLAMLVGGPALAQIVLPSGNPQGPDLGKVAQAPATTSIWRVDPDTGDVALISGDAMRLTRGPSAPPQIALDCTTPNCRNATITAAFAPSASGQATIVGLTPGTVSARGLKLVSVAGAGTTHLIMTFLAGDTLPVSATFPLGMTVRLSPGREGASPNYGYTMQVQLH